MHYLEKLLAQRTHFITALYADKQNVEDNRKRLNAAARQLANKHQPFDTEAKWHQLHCYLPLTIARESRSDFGEFIIKIISLNKKMNWEYSVNLKASDLGQVIEPDYHGHNIQWTKATFSSDITPTKLTI